MEVTQVDAGRMPSAALADAVVQSLRRRLQNSCYRVLRQISCQQHDGAIVLRGRVPSYFLKQMAQVVLLADPRAVHVVNLIEVATDTGSSDDQPATTLAPTRETPRS